MFYSTCWNFDNKFLEKFSLIDCSSYRSVIGIDLHVIWWSPIRFSSLISKFISSFSSCREYLHKNQKKATYFLDSILTQKTQRKKKQMRNGSMEWINWTVKKKTWAIQTINKSSRSRNGLTREYWEKTEIRIIRHTNKIYTILRG